MTITGITVKNGTDTMCTAVGKIGRGKAHSYANLG